MVLFLKDLLHPLSFGFGMTTEKQSEQVINHTFLILNNSYYHPIISKFR